jgi:hypothetical protein
MGSQLRLSAEPHATRLAAAIPPLARARMRTHSSSPKADRKARIPRPMGVVRSSHWRSRALNVAPRAALTAAHQGRLRKFAHPLMELLAMATRNFTCRYSLIALPAGFSRNLRDPALTVVAVSLPVAATYRPVIQGTGHQYRHTLPACVSYAAYSFRGIAP